MVIVDESTMIKNSQADRSKAIHKLGHRARYRIAMTGAPVTNHFEDIFSQMYFVDQCLGPSITKFKNRYMFQPNKFVPYMWKEKEGSTEKIKPLMADRVLRITKDECLDLPPRTELVREVQLSDRCRKHYRSMHEEMYALMESGEEITAAMRLTQTLKLQQITGGFIFDTENSELLVIDEKPPKIREVLATLAEASPETKVIIWAWFRHDFALLERHLKPYGPRTINGATSVSKIPEIVESFRDDPSHRVLLAHPGSCKFGHTWNWATLSIFYSYSYDVEAYIQSRDRNYRLGQREKVTEITLVGSQVDRKIRTALRENVDFGLRFSNDAQFRVLWESLKE
jgi:SNF2 family DNA or RNA helicase